MKDINDARVVNLYHQLEKKAEKLGLSIDTSDSSFGVYKEECEKNTLVFFCNVIDEVFAYLSGYEKAKNSLDNEKA